MQLFEPNEEIRALSLKQPFASLMLHGKIETRTWPTSYRGKVLICSSKSPYGTMTTKNICGPDQYDRAWDILTDHPMPMGYAIAIGNLVDCRPMTLEDEAKCFVKYREGLWCHVYENVQPIHPFKWIGSQKWKTLNNNEKSNIFHYSVEAPFMKKALHPDVLFQMVTEWQRKTFGQANAASKAWHLIDEARELRDSIMLGKSNEEEARMELADCFILLFGISDSKGMKWPDIAKAIEDKFIILQSRNWGTPDENGVVKHIKS